MRWLAPQLGTAAATDPKIADAPDAAIIDVRDLVDRDGNSVEALRRTIDEGVALLAGGRRVIVCCDYGLSRSNAIAAGMLAAWHGTSVDHALQALHGVAALDELKLDVLAAVRRALQEPMPQPGASGVVAVTGASGFVGERLVLALDPFASVIPITRDAVELLHGSLPLETIVRTREVDTIVHLAHPRVVTTNASLSEAVAMMKTVLDVTAVSGVRLVFVSGWEVFSGYGEADLLADESLPPRPASVYGQAKALCESLLGYATQARGISSCIVRAGPAFGVGSDRPRFLRAFTRHALRSEPIVTHVYDNGRPALDLLHVDDVVDGLRRIALSDVSGTFHLGSGTARTTRRVAEIVRGSTDSDVVIEERRIGATVTNVSMDCHRATAELGWRPQKDVQAELDLLVRSIARDLQPGQP